MIFNFKNSSNPKFYFHNHKRQLLHCYFRWIELFCCVKSNSLSLLVVLNSGISSEKNTFRVKGTAKKKRPGKCQVFRRQQLQVQIQLRNRDFNSIKIQEGKF